MNDNLPVKWVGGICIKEGNILLIHRINKEKDFNQEFFVFPGGIVRDDESIEDALVREVDEASIKVKVGELFFTTEEDENDDADYYYQCEYLMGEPALSMKSDEADIMEDGNQMYTPMWVPLSELDDLIVYPETVKNKVLFELGDR